MAVKIAVSRKLRKSFGKGVVVNFIGIGKQVNIVPHIIVKIVNV